MILPEILEIYNDIILNTTAVYDYEPHTFEMRKKWFETKQEQGFPVFVATKAKKLQDSVPSGRSGPGLLINIRLKIQCMLQLISGEKELESY